MLQLGMTYHIEAERVPVPVPSEESPSPSACQLEIALWVGGWGLCSPPVSDQGSVWYELVQVSYMLSVSDFIPVCPVLSG